MVVGVCRSQQLLMSRCTGINIMSSLFVSHRSVVVNVVYTVKVNWQLSLLLAPFGLWGCKNRPAPFPGRMS